MPEDNPLSRGDRPDSCRLTVLVREWSNRTRIWKVSFLFGKQTIVFGEMAVAEYFSRGLESMPASHGSVSRMFKQFRTNGFLKGQDVLEAV